MLLKATLNCEPETRLVLEKSRRVTVLGCHPHDVLRNADPSGMTRFSFYCIDKHAIVSDAERVGFQIEYFSVQLDLVVLRVT